VKHESIVKTFKKCSISSPLDCIDDDALFEGSKSPNNNISDEKDF
jgi:hypothetical protein